MTPSFPRRILDAWMDPLRRRNSLARIAEGWVGGLITLLAFSLLPWPWIVVSPLMGVLAEFLVYEFVLEPHGYAGPYWERGPRDGETFVRG